MYNNCGGERYANFIRNIGSTVFRDVPKDELLRFNNHLLNYGEEAKLEDLPAAGLSADYVFRETQRALAGVQASAGSFRESTSGSRPAGTAGKRRPRTRMRPWPRR